MEDRPQEPASLCAGEGREAASVGICAEQEPTVRTQAAGRAAQALGGEGGERWGNQVSLSSPLACIQAAAIRAKRETGIKT